MKTSHMVASIRSVATTLLLLMISVGFVQSQSCDYIVGRVQFSSSGQNSSDLYTTIYILTDGEGQILAISSKTEFNIFTKGLYFIYGANFKTTNDLDGLDQGASIYSLTSDCLELSAPLPITVCESITPCDYCIGEDVSFNIDGGNSQEGFTTQYFLTNTIGNIVVIQDSLNFGALPAGIYIAYAINYEDEKGIEGLELNNNILDIRGLCYDLSEGVLFAVCQALDPQIQFDINNCDVLVTATIILEQQYDTYFWSTGSTESSITVDATTPMTYAVTVTTASGCQGTDSITLTGVDYSAIGDFVWEDTNANGIQDIGENGLNGVIISLFADDDADGFADNPDNPLCITVSSNNPNVGSGYYIFNVYPGNYVLNFQSPIGYKGSPVNSGDNDGIDNDADSDNGFTNTITAVFGQNLTNIDAGFFAESGLGGFVWDDMNGDGVQDQTEPGINNVTINLYDESRQLVSTVTTANDPMSDEPGYYCFNGLSPLDYYVEILLPDGYVLSPANQRTDDDIDSDADGTNGPNTTSFYSLVSGEKQDNADFGIYLGGTVCGVVWKESGESENNLYDIGVDEPIVNTELELISFDNGNQIIALASTNNAGEYCFTEIPAGSYTIRPRTVGNNAGNSFVGLNQSEDELIDSDVDPNTGSTEMFFIGPGQTINGVNAGLRPGALPVELINFSGRWNKQNNEIILFWSTASEINNDKFVVERVVGESGKFKSIGEVTGNGTSYEQVDYNFVDNDVTISATYYYRLRQIDYDGGYEYSPIIAINVEPNDIFDLNIYPNPVSDWIYVEVDIQNSAFYTGELLDLSGRRIHQWSESLQKKGMNKISFNIADIRSGTYLLSITIGTKTISKLIVKME